MSTIVAADAVATCPEMHALLRLNAELLEHDSATLTLERWCDARGLASPAHVVAERQHGVHAEPSGELRRLLAAGAGDPIRHRRVRLRCAGRVLSEADNWYVPSRLTDEMNRVLDGTDVAFGRAVRSLNFRRRTLSSRLLWSPLSLQGWPHIPPHVLEHRALLTLPDGTPFSHLVETYTSEVLAVAEPPSPAAATFAAKSGRARGIRRAAERTLALAAVPLPLPA